MNFSMFPFKLKMKSLVVLVFAVVALSVMECSVAGTKFGFFFCSFTFAYVSRNQSPFIPEGGGGWGGLCEASVNFDFATTKLT